MQSYLFWSQEHGDVYINADNEQEAWDKFYEDHCGNGDYEVVVHLFDELGESYE